MAFQTEKQRRVTVKVLETVSSTLFLAAALISLFLLDFYAAEGRNMTFLQKTFRIAVFSLFLCHGFLELGIDSLLAWRFSPNPVRSKAGHGRYIPLAKRSSSETNNISLLNILQSILFVAAVSVQGISFSYVSRIPVNDNASGIAKVLGTTAAGLWLGTALLLMVALCLFRSDSNIKTSRFCLCCCPRTTAPQAVTSIANIFYILSVAAWVAAAWNVMTAGDSTFLAYGLVQKLIPVLWVITGALYLVSDISQFFYGNTDDETNEPSDEDVNSSVEKSMAYDQVSVAAGPMSEMTHNSDDFKV